MTQHRNRTRLLMLSILCCILSISCDILDVKKETLNKLETDDCVIFLDRMTEQRFNGSTYLEVRRYDYNRFWPDDWDLLCWLDGHNLGADLTLLSDDLLLVGVVSPAGIIIDPYVVIPIDTDMYPVNLYEQDMGPDMDRKELIENTTHYIEKYQSTDDPDYYLIHAWPKEYSIDHRNFYVMDAASVDMRLYDDSTLQVNVDWNADIDSSVFYIRLAQDPRESLEVFLDSLPAVDTSGYK